SRVCYLCTAYENQMQDLLHGRVPEIDRHNRVAQVSPSPEREPSARLVELLSSVPEVRFSLVSVSWRARVLHTVLAGLTGVVWAFSLVSLPISTGRPAVFYGYAAASAGFTVICALVAVNNSGVKRGFTTRADFGIVGATWITH